MQKGPFGRLITVKLGGSAMDDDNVVHQLAEDIRSAAGSGIGFIVVHGGGKAITREMDARGIKTVKVAGLRVTDDASMEVVESVMGKTNDSICQILKQHGVKAEKVLGSDGLLICDKMPPAKAKEGGGERLVDLGRVGSVSKVDPSMLEGAIGRGSVPVVAPYGRTASGVTMNVNADTAAGSIAGACSDEFVLLTDVEGVIVPGTDTVGVARELTLGQIGKLVGAAVIKDGMLPKVEACAHAIRSGVKSARIVNGLGEHPLKAVLAGDEIGTRILP